MDNLSQSKIILSQSVMKHHKLLLEAGVQDSKRALIDDLARILGDISAEDRHLLLMSAGITNPSAILNVLSRHLHSMQINERYENARIEQIINELKNLSALFKKE